MVIAKSFARIHRSNLINFGILPVHFKNAGDYEKIEKGDRLLFSYLKKSLTGNQSYSVQNLTKNYSFEASSNLNGREKEIILTGGLLPFTKKNLQDI